MNDHSKNRAGNGPIFSQDMADSLQVQMQALLQEQAELLDETQKVMAAWTKRRQDGMEANFRTFQTMGSCTGPTAMCAAYSEWLANSMNGIFADMDAVREEALRLAELGRISMTTLLGQGANTSPQGSTKATTSGEEVRKTRSDS